MTAEDKRAAVVAAYKIILGRNTYSQDSVKREYCFVKYKDGKYYSDCSSSIRLAYKRADIGLNNIGGNTVAMYQNSALKTVNCKIVNGVPTDISAIQVGDILLFAGTDTSRAYADYVGHVELVYAISGSTVTLAGHGSGTPSTKNMVTYCKSRQSTKTSTKKGNKGLLKVVRAIPDDIVPANPAKEMKAEPIGGIKITGGTVNIRKGPGTQYGVAMIATKGQTFEAVDTAGWRPVCVNGAVLWVSEVYSERITT